MKVSRVRVECPIVTTAHPVLSEWDFVITAYFLGVSAVGVFPFSVFVENIPDNPCKHFLVDLGHGLTSL
jgi:hypothetical protein